LAKASEITKPVGRFVQKRKDAEMHQPPGATPDKSWGNIQHFDIWDFPVHDL